MGEVRVDEGKTASSNARRTATHRFGRRQRAFADETRCHGASTGRLWPPRTRKSGECRLKAHPKVLTKLRAGTPVPRSTVLKMLRRLASRHNLGRALADLVVDTRSS